MDETQTESAPRERHSLSVRFHTRLQRYRNLFRTKWWVLLIPIAIALGVQSYLLWNAPQEYASTGHMILNAHLSLPNANVYNEEINNFYGTQSALMQSGTVLGRVILRLQTTKPELQKHAVPVALQVGVSPRTSIFNLRASGRDPAYVQAYLDAVMEEYTGLKREMLLHASDTTKSGLQESLVGLSQELQQGKLELVNFETTNSVVFLQDQGFNAGNYLAYLNKQLADLKSELQLLKMLTLDENAERLQQQSGAFRLAAQPPAPVNPANNTGTPQTSINPVASPNAGDTTGVSDANTGLVGSEEEYLKARQQIILMKAQRDELSEYLRDKHPKIIALDEDIARKEKLLDIFRNQTKDQLANRQHTIEIQMANLEDQIKEWDIKALDISKKMAAYQEIKERNQRLQAMYDSLLTTENTVDVQKEISPESVTLLDAASPAAPVSLEAPKHLAIATCIGLILGIAILLWLDRLDDRPGSFSELEDVFDEPILGQIPWDPLKHTKAVVSVIQPDDARHSMVEAYRNLRSSLVFMGGAQSHPKTILLTSAIPGDGKSMTSANLAITIARAGSRVLLVDADLRRGLLHKQFEVAASPGFAEVLAGQAAWKPVVAPTTQANLFILPRGVAPRHPGELFSGSTAQTFLKEAVTEYDFVLFDTPPVMAADDVSNLAPFVDGVIMVIRANYTSARVARAALDLLYLRRAKILGLVFNGVRARGADYYYYKYHDYYASYPAK